jgi:cytochrome P450
MRMSGAANAAQVDLGLVDLTDPVLYGDGEPHAVFAALRGLEHLHWQAVGDSGFWSAARHADVATVLGDHETFTSEGGTLLGILGREDPASRNQMAVTDPPRHRYLRQPIGRPLRTRAMAEHAAILRKEIRALLVPAVDGETVDFAHAMMSLSTAVAGLVMGLSRADWPELTVLATTAIAPDDPDFALPGGREATLAHAHRQLFAYFEDVVADRRRSGGSGTDLISVLLSIRMEDGEPLSPGAIVANCYSLLMGASVTSPHVPSSLLLELIRTGGFGAWAGDDRRLEQGLEESLRWASPANHFMRYAMRDVEVSGTKIRFGEAVVAWIGSADRDELVFAEPHSLSIDRWPNPHLAFGAGPHYCVGHHAARQTLRILYEEMGATFEDVELAGPARHLSSNFVAGIKALPVRAAARRCIRG